MQQLTYVFYTMAFLFVNAAGKPLDLAQPIDWSVPVPDLAEYQQRMWAGDIDLADRNGRLTYGRVNLARLLHDVRQPRYREALRTVMDRRGA